jgi:hypothetical protein
MVLLLLLLLLYHQLRNDLTLSARWYATPPVAAQRFFLPSRPDAVDSIHSTAPRLSQERA